MCELIIFGGTTEGRLLHDYVRTRKIPAITCVATEYGESLLEGGGVRVGRLNKDEIAALLEAEKPALVIDATHPYAVEVSRNVKAACEETGARHMRILRASSESGGFSGLDELIKRLKTSRGAIFAALGVKEARALTALPDYAERVWLRILPSAEGISECLALGYPARRIICMQGPFSKELNLAMFRDTGAEILVTKDSGLSGGFNEKLAAATELGMEIFLLSRPDDTNGVSLEEAKGAIAAL